MEKERGLTGYPSIDKPWLKYYSEDTINTPLPECTIYEYFFDNNKDFPTDIAINYLGHKISYKELFDNIDATASAFLKAGVMEKEIVTVALPSIPEALYCVYALNKIGAIANMIHPLAGKEETLRYFNEVKSSIVVIFDGAFADIADEIEMTSVKKVIVASPADSLPLVLKAAYNLKVKRPDMDGKTFQSWKAFIQDGKGTKVKIANKDCRETAIISHTGGTTGEPKGVMCSDYNVNAQIWQIVSNFPYNRQERFLVVLPPFINYSLINSMLEPLAFGFQIIMIPDYKPDQFAKYIKKYKPNHINSIPLYWEAILSIKNLDRADFSCLDHLYYGGEGMAEASERAVNKILIEKGARHELCRGLGSTEMVSAATVTYENCNDFGSVGIPLNKVNCMIKDFESDRECNYGTKGEICFSGPTLMIGYYNNDEATDNIIKTHTDGQRWLHTGDIGYIDERGVLYMTGRIKRIVATFGKDGNGTKFFPDRIEKVINNHPDVELCCVIGVPHPVRLNYPKALIVLKEGVSLSDTIKDEILLMCKEQLPDYMVPDEIEFCEALPRTERGKVDYRALEEQAKIGSL
jgi:long-chain acyl-CoA synthetase